MERLSIIVVERDRDRAIRIVDGLRASGDHQITVIAEETGLARRIAQAQPDIVLIDVADPSRDVLEELALASGPLDRPVAMFVDRSDEQLTRTAIEAGVSAYVVDGLQRDRIKPILGRGHRAVPPVPQDARRTGRHQGRAGGAQDHRPRQGHPDEGARHRRPTSRSCRWLRRRSGQRCWTPNQARSQSLGWCQRTGRSASAPSDTSRHDGCRVRPSKSSPLWASSDRVPWPGHRHPRPQARPRQSTEARPIGARASSSSRNRCGNPVTRLVDPGRGLPRRNRLSSRLPRSGATPSKSRSWAATSSSPSTAKSSRPTPSATTRPKSTVRFVNPGGRPPRSARRNPNHRVVDLPVTKCRAGTGT